MARQTSFNLFIYGTLTNPWVFRAVLGKHLVIDPSKADQPQTLLAREAVLTGFKKVSPDRTYLYAVPAPQGRIQGYVVGPLPNSAMSALRDYEGRNYRRRTVSVHTASGAEKAVVFLGDLDKIDQSFGTQFRDPFKQEVLLRQKIEDALSDAEQRDLRAGDDATLRALTELHGPTIRDLIRRHFEAGGISDYAIRRSLQDGPLRDYDRIVTDPAAKPTAPHYLAMVVRQVIFNQFEDMIRREFRYELDHMNLGEAYYARTVSSLAALRIVNRSQNLVEILVGDCLAELEFSASHLVDFVKWAVVAADTIFDVTVARQQLSFLRHHMGRGYVPLGAELEFSNIGQGVIDRREHRHSGDGEYDGFLYFNDFALDSLTWKLGGHVDDHREKAPGRPRRGFFETALGNVSIEANLSKPLTDDPWMLNQIIHETRRFFDIRPHSLHISLQLRRQHKPGRDRLLPLGVLQCLFAIVGDMAVNRDGRLTISRLTRNEIVGDALPERDDDAAVPHMLFSEILRKRSRSDDGQYQGVALPDESGRYIQQFKFMRLSPKLNYEPIAMALKGIQIALRPGTFLMASQYETSRRHRRVFDDLLAWGAEPTPLSPADIDRFLSTVHDGLMVEKRGKPAHTQAYIHWAIGRLRSMLDEFNRRLAKAQSTVARSK